MNFLSQEQGDIEAERMQYHETKHVAYDDVTLEANQRRSANYKPNIWKYNFLQSLTSKYQEEEYRGRFEKLVEDVKGQYDREWGLLPKLEFIDSVHKLGLGSHFHYEIEEALTSINSNPIVKEDLYTNALCFRLLRQHGYKVSSADMLRVVTDENGIFKKSSIEEDIKGVLELFEASHLAFDNESIFDEVKVYTMNILKEAFSNSATKIESNLLKHVVHALELPSHRRVPWFDVRWHINEYGNREHMNIDLLQLSKLNFNIIQATLQKDLKESCRWWTNQGLKEHMNFARDRLVECFMCSVGLISDPQYGSFRKCLTKVINFILVIDDIYDIYGSIEELKQFTDAVIRWNKSEIEQLPECMEGCFQSLYDVNNDIAHEFEMENTCNHVLPHLKKVVRIYPSSWEDYCKALYVEAKWYSKGYTPSLDEYLSNAWISSAGPVILVHTFIAIIQDHDEAVTDDQMKDFQDLFYNISLIIRLCNDLGTTVFAQAEQERGDAASSVICCMRDMNVSEEIARNHIKGMIDRAWKSINGKCFTHNQTHLVPSLQPFVSIITNASRVAQTLYQHGDGFGDQDKEIREQILSLVT
ncbi:Farnesene synthase [Quillaja saponaria]|uniref:Farnesene synthase n=1 Tax=Quillaja saponaria TaxID=32244 RepID=A0AAD7KMM6_QUISA|nr:Farnesene synthase [Quillaja saponaria]